MATKKEVAAARAARRDRSRQAVLNHPLGAGTTVNAADVAQGSHVVITPAGNANILPKPSPELVSIHALPGNLAQKTDYLGNLYDLPSDATVRAYIQKLAERSDRPHLEAAVKLLENQFSGPVVDHTLPNPTTGVTEYFDAGGNKIEAPKVIPPPTVTPAALNASDAKAASAATAKADKEAAAKAKKDAALAAKAAKKAAK